MGINPMREVAECMYVDSWIRKATTFGFAIAAMLVANAGQVQAGVISGNHYTDGGKLVNLQGLEWLTWDETKGISRSSIEAGYNGLLSDGWRYATRSELSLLFLSISPANAGNGWDTDNYDGTRWLWENFDNPNFLAPTSNISRLGYLFVGADGEHYNSAVYSYYAFWLAGTSNEGWLSDSWGRLGTSNWVSKAYSGGASGFIASVLVRAPSNTTVPEPTSLAMFGIGALGLVFRRPRRS